MSTEPKDLCPSCGYPKTYTYNYPEQRVVTGKGKIKKEDTGKTVQEWICEKCGNSGYSYE